MKLIGSPQILIVSGDPLRAQLLRSNLACAGYETYIAVGEAVLELVQNQGPEMLMMD